MKLIDREMKAVESITAKSNHSLKCQASFNSDGVLTLRDYNMEDKNSDEIIFRFREEKTMNNDELKKKIIRALQSVEFVTEKGWCGQCISLRLDYSAIADALIAAGIGDVKDVEAEANRYEMLYKLQNRDMALAERRAHDVEHRAEVAEMALKNACEDVKEIVSFLIELSERVDGLRVEGYLPEESEPKAYINRAEKELAEEEKDGNETA